MIEEKKDIKLSHNLILKERKSLNISGVLDVDSFDDNAVVAYTDLGELTIKGSNLHINKINLDSGDLELDGEVYSLEYAEDRPAERGFFSKLFR
ncbi:sporulation protein YabP [Clostridium sp. CAG:557]|jgi:sporulation protein YabP|nr:sporulation protein YabP [Clostridium sp. CAG:557]